MNGDVCNCTYCGKPLSRRRIREKAKYHDVVCYGESLRSPDGEWRICKLPSCDVVYWVSPSRMGRGRSEYCVRDHAIDAQRKHEVGVPCARPKCEELAILGGKYSEAECYQFHRKERVPKHGSEAMYWRGCRCAACVGHKRKLNRERMRRSHPGLKSGRRRSSYWVPRNCQGQGCEIRFFAMRSVIARGQGKYHSQSCRSRSLGFSAKLTENEVREIKQLLVDRNQTQKEIGEKYGVSSMAISQIANGRTWKHVVMDGLSQPA
ncbi:hypothetical protein LCGC14_2493890 [marine sediment metagenome]|uniref:Uncharacterized protein n=1 Tax=marine sediment metagenome TaxID=412755 RepID=A0A0F9B3W3_9ZZZZ